MIKKILFLLIAFSFTLAIAQQKVELSNLAKISIITSGPGEQLYEKFGHTAIRIQDSVHQFDLIYNYGFFDLSGADFYINFTRGYMKYKLVRYPFHYSLRSARQDKRWMKEQVLNLTLQQKNTFYRFLENNALPENASYFYDPFFNNCATKPYEIIFKVFGNTINWSDDFTSNKSLRQLMNIEINQNTWGSLGINVALGNRLDKKASFSEYSYLPDYVFKALSTAKIKKDGQVECLVKKTETLLSFDEKKPTSDVINPLLIFSLVFLVGLFITYKDYKTKQRTKWLDFTLFFSTGLTGVLIIFLWFFTNHSTAPNNFNILWGFTLNIFVAFYVVKKKPPKWISTYLKALLILLILIPLIWIGGVQLFNFTLIPLLLLLAIRYVFLYKTLNS